MANTKKKRANYYSVLSILLVILAGAYLATAQQLIKYELGPEGQFWLITGAPRVAISEDLLTLVFKARTRSATLVFNQPLAGQAFANDTQWHPNYRITWDAETRQAISIESAGPSVDDDPIGFDSIQVRIGHLFGSGRKTDRQLVSAYVDGRNVRPYEFLTDILVREDSSIALYYPMALDNIPSEVAQRIGDPFLKLIVAVLLVMAGLQLGLLLFAIKLQPDSVGRYFISSKKNSAVPTLDKICSDFAIPLGLMGTITAIWIALEQPSANFSSFGQILSILRFAVFTTVLGMVTKLLCLARGHVKSMISNNNE